MADTSEISAATESDNPIRTQAPTAWRFWVVAWLCTALAGGVFGLFLAGIIGFVFGTGIALLVAIPVLASFAVVTWALRLSRFSIMSAGLAGACTGYLSVVWIGGGPEWPAVIAAIVGGHFSFIGCALSFGGGNSLTLPTANEVPTTWQFSLRDLFLRFTAVSVLIAVWTALLARFLR